jgi:ankyrin repeat protein
MFLNKSINIFESKVCGSDGNTLLHLCAADADEDAAVFLVDNGAAIDQVPILPKVTNIGLQIFVTFCYF